MKINPIFYNNNSYKPSFQSKTSAISTERLISLVESGKTVKQMKSELGIALDTFYKLLRERGIEYRKKTISEKVKGITKAQIEEFLNSGDTVSEICSKLGINSSQYYMLLEKFSIKSPKKMKTERASAITKADLEKSVKEFATVKERCLSLGISKDVYFRLIKQYEIMTPYKQQVKHNSSISEKDVIDLINKGKPVQEIIGILGISEDFYKRLLKKNNIMTASKKSKQNIATISKEKLESFFEQGKKVSEICEELGISKKTYSRLLNKFGIMTKRKKDRLNVSHIKKEDIEILVKRNIPPDEICKYLGINKTTFYELLKILNIDYNYVHHSNEIDIPKKVLEQAAKSGKTVKKISEKLGICTTTYNSKARINKIETVYRDSITRIASVTKEDLQQVIDKGLSVTEICEYFKITHSNYRTLVQKYNLKMGK